jgi:hypothetical protein
MRVRFWGKYGQVSKKIPHLLKIKLQAALIIIHNDISETEIEIL